MSNLKLPGRIPIRQAIRMTTDEKAPFQERMRSEEQTGLAELNGSMLLLDQGLPKLEKRLRKLKMWWMVKGMLGIIRKVNLMLELSAEPAQMRTLTARAEQMKVRIGFKTDSADPNVNVVMTEDLAVLTSSALEHQCSFCQLKGNEAMKCPMQKALRACTIADDSTIIDGCMFRPYSDAAYYGLLDDEEKDEFAGKALQGFGGKDGAVGANERYAPSGAECGDVEKEEMTL